MTKKSNPIDTEITESLLLTCSAGDASRVAMTCLRIMSGISRDSQFQSELGLSENTEDIAITSLEWLGDYLLVLSNTVKAWELPVDVEIPPEHFPKAKLALVLLERAIDWKLYELKFEDSAAIDRFLSKLPDDLTLGAVDELIQEVALANEARQSEPSEPARYERPKKIWGHRSKPWWPKSAADARGSFSLDDWNLESIKNAAVEGEDLDALRYLSILSLTATDETEQPIDSLHETISELGLAKTLQMLGVTSLEELAWNGKFWEDRILGLRLLFLSGSSIVEALNDPDLGIAKEAYLLISGRNKVNVSVLNDLLAHPREPLLPTVKELRAIVTDRKYGAPWAITLLSQLKELSIVDEILLKLDTFVSSYVGTRTGCRFIRVGRRGYSSTSDKDAPWFPLSESQWFETKSDDCDYLTHYSAKGAKSYWGPSEISKLERHLIDPAPENTLIAGWNDDGWVATADPEVIYYMSGIDFYPCNCTEDCDIAFEGGGPWRSLVLARRLYEELADTIDAQKALTPRPPEELRSNGTAPGQETREEKNETVHESQPWKNVGLYAEAVRRGTLYTPKPSDRTGHGRSLSDEGEKRTDLFVSEIIGPTTTDSETGVDTFTISQHDSYIPNWKSPYLSITVTKPDLMEYLSRTGVWPKWLPPEVLFSLYEEEITALGPEVWVEQMGIPAWRKIPFFCNELPTLADIEKMHLPPGRPWQSPDGRFGWIVNEDVPNLNELWLEWAKKFPNTGLWPIAQKVREGWPSPGSHTWQENWKDPYRIPANIYEHYPQEYESYRSEFDSEDWRIDAKEVLEDLGREVDLRLAPGEIVPGNLLQRLGLPPEIEYLILVPCHRPADASLALDFGIPNDNKTPGVFTGILRSWEERFGVVPVSLDVTETTFQVLAPPITEENVQLLANELALFAWDSWNQGGISGSNETNQDLWGNYDFSMNQLDALVQHRQWRIWWD